MSEVSIKLDAIFSALSHSTRRALLYHLSLQPATILQLATAHEISLPAIHKHIRSLEEANLILRKKVGRTNFVALNKSSLLCAQNWTNQFRADWGNDEESLENYITSMKESV
jgi:DNA-binding transcriptional ArsR family regulator